jgi:hypothetical protein
LKLVAKISENREIRRLLFADQPVFCQQLLPGGGIQIDPAPAFSPGLLPLI